MLIPEHHPRWRGWLYHAITEIHRKADLLFALTNAHRQTLMQLGISAERIAVSGIDSVLADEADSGSFLESHQIERSMVLFIEHHYPYMGYRQLLQAAPLIWKAIPDAYFVFIEPSVENSNVTLENLLMGGFINWIYQSPYSELIHQNAALNRAPPLSPIAVCLLSPLGHDEAVLKGSHVSADY